MICRLRIRKPALRNRSCGVEHSEERRAAELRVALLLMSGPLFEWRASGRLSRRRCNVIRPLLDWVCDRDRRANLCRISGTHAGTLDWGVRGCTFRARDSDRRKGDAAERSCELTILSEYAFARPICRSSAGSGSGGWRGQVGNKEFHDGVGVVGAAFEAVVGGLQGLQTFQEAGLWDFAGGLQGELGLFGAHGQGAGGLVAVGDAF